MDDNNTLCLYPFTQMLLQPTGVLSPCCWNQKIVYGVVPEVTIQEAWNSKIAQKLRQEFLDGNPKMCAQQIRHISCHKYSHLSTVSNLEFKAIQPLGPSRLDVRLNGRCNLQCVMCEVWKQPNGVYDASDFWRTGPTKIFPHLAQIDVLGGEPFVQADTYRLIDEVSAVNSKCTWAFVTNGSYKFTDGIRRALDKIQMRWIQVSIDSLEPLVYSKIRIKGKLERTLKTVDQVLEYQDERKKKIKGFFRVVASLCVQKENWREVPKFLEFCQTKRLEPILQFAYTPLEVSVLSLLKSELEEIYELFETCSQRYGSKELAPVLLPVQDAIKPKRPFKSGSSRTATSSAAKTLPIET